MTNYTKKLAKGSAVLLLMGVISVILGYVLKIYLARNLTVSEFGLFYSVSAFIGIFGFVKDFGLSTTVAKFIPEFLTKKENSKVSTLINTCLSIQFLIGIVISIILILSSGYIAESFFHDPTAKPIIQILSIEFIIGFPLLKGVLQGLQKISLYSIIDPIRVGLVFITVLFLIGNGAFGVSVSYLFAAIIINAALFFYIFKVSKLVAVHFDSDLTKKTLVFSLPIFINTVLAVIISYTDTLTITYFTTLRDVGIYQIALSTSQLLWVFTSALGVALLPLISELYEVNKKKLTFGISIIMKYLFVFIVPLSIIFLVFPDTIISVVFGHQYLSTPLVLQILSISAIIYSLYSVMLTTLVGIGKSKSILKITAIVVTFNIFSNIFLVQFFGIVGAALTSLISYFIGGVLSFGLIRKKLKIALDVSSLIKTVLGGVLTVVLLFVIKDMIPLGLIQRMVFAGFCGFIFYGAFLILTKTIKKQDVEILYNIKIPTFIIKLIKSVVRE